MSALVYLLIATLLVLLNGFFVLAEFAAVKMRPSRIRELLDGGVRRGIDVLRARALGAQAVCVGRPVLWGLACAGEGGVERVLSILRHELDVALALSGFASPDEVGADLLRP